MEPKGKILVADDEPSVRFTTAELLRIDGFSVIEADGGATAVALAIEHVPDVILLDVNMPGVSGVDAAKQMRLNPDLLHIPIIQMSGDLDPAVREMAFTIGCVAFLSKPFGEKDLLEVANHWLRVGVLHGDQ